jgi:hypothetical protein
VHVGRPALPRKSAVQIIFFVPRHPNPETSP